MSDDVHYNVQITIQEVRKPQPVPGTTSYNRAANTDEKETKREIIQLASIAATDKNLTHLITKAKGHLDLVID
jgi:hypothetical protein